jgi:hypothetical protein
VHDQPAFLRIRNWERYQIHHDGRPMKYFAVQAITDGKRTGILDDPAFLAVIDDPECPVFRLMAYAAQTNNKIPNDQNFLRAKLFTTRRVNLKKLLDAKLLEPWVKETHEYGSTKPRTETQESVPREEEIRKEEKREEQHQDVRQVYDHWRTQRNRTHGRFRTITPNRRKKITSRLEEFTSEELIRAIDGVALDPWDERPRHDDITIIFRSQEQVEKFIALAENPPPQKITAAQLLGDAA